MVNAHIDFTALFSNGESDIATHWPNWCVIAQSKTCACFNEICVMYVDCIVNITDVEK